MPQSCLQHFMVLSINAVRPDMESPTISVVMGVYNDADNIESTVSSLLCQQGVDLELVIVDDGSTDSTAEKLSAMATQDSRIKLLRRPNRGLTRSLAEACDIAKGEFLARQDSGDWSSPGRLKKQVECLLCHSNASLCSSYVRYIVPEGVTIEIRKIDSADLASGLSGPAHHGSVMMRKSIYHRVGGYRPSFYYAQDIDLWSRMTELGSHQLIPEVLYTASVSAGSITGSRRKEQDSFHRIIESTTSARRSNQSEDRWLNEAEALSQRCRHAPRTSGQIAAGAYYIGSCLFKEEPSLAHNYLSQAVNLNPWHLRARLKLLRCKR